MKVTTDDAHDSEALPALINDASKLRRISGAVMDGAYDNAEAYKLLRRISVKPIIKPRRNARADRGPPERRRAARLIRRMGDEGWAGMMGYGRRWAAETAFSTFIKFIINLVAIKTRSRQSFTPLDFNTVTNSAFNNPIGRITVQIKISMINLYNTVSAYLLLHKNDKEDGHFYASLPIA